VQQQVRRRVLRWFARASHLDAAHARDMASCDHGGGFWLRPLRLTPAKPALACIETSLSLRFRGMLRSASKAPTAPAWTDVQRQVDTGPTLELRGPRTTPVR
jgi:hypothetical protein